MVSVRALRASPLAQPCRDAMTDVRIADIPEHEQGAFYATELAQRDRQAVLALSSGAILVAYSMIRKRYAKPPIETQGKMDDEARLYARVDR
jgi:hypothetical protein